MFIKSFDPALSMLLSMVGGRHNKILSSGFSSRKQQGGKGQLRTAKPKASGAAALKRAAKTRNNIRKRAGK